MKDVFFSFNMKDVLYVINLIEVSYDYGVICNYDFSLLIILIK